MASTAGELTGPTRPWWCRIAGTGGRTPEYLRMAAGYLEVAERMSLKTDRARMTEIAQRWLDLAQQAEANAQPDT